MARKKTPGATITERTRILFGDNAQVHKHALDGWARCLQETTMGLEEKFNESEWRFLGNTYSDENTPSILTSSVPFSVTLEHIIKDNMDLFLSNDKQLGTEVVAKLGTLSVIEAAALHYTLQFFAENKEDLNEQKWWTLEARLRLRKTSIGETGKQSSIEQPQPGSIEQPKSGSIEQSSPVKLGDEPKTENL